MNSDDGMEDLIKQNLSTLDTEIIDCFRELFYEASDKQLKGILDKYENASGLNKDWVYDDGVEANMVRWLGEQLILLSLYHSFEIKLKEIIEFKQSSSGNEDQNSTVKLHRWNDLKRYIPTDVKNSEDYRQVNILRELVNCIKHSGIVNEDLNKLAPSFGNIGDEISYGLDSLYEGYKSSASRVIRKTYENNETHN